MAKFDRYLLSQLMVVFGLFSFVLVLVYWINRAVLLFDQLIADGQSAAVFLEFTLLSLPNVARLVLPIAAVAATLYVTNRLTQDSELVVVQATGYGPFRLARPVLAFGLIVGILVGGLVNFVVPPATGALSDRRGEIAENLAARLLQEGQFLHPGDGLTIFIREIGRDGELRDIFLSDTGSPDRQLTYSAERARLVRAVTGPTLVMFDGMVQSFDVSGRSLAVTRFEDLSYDLSDLLGAGERQRRIEEMPTLELLAARPATLQEVDRPRARLIAEGHERISQSTLAIVAPLLGFSILLLGGYTRFGIWKQVLAAIVVVVLVKLVDKSLIELAMADARLWPLTYAGTLVACGLVAATLWIAGRPLAFLRRRRSAAA